MDMRIVRSISETLVTFFLGIALGALIQRHSQPDPVAVLAERVAIVAGDVTNLAAGEAQRTEILHGMASRIQTIQNDLKSVDFRLQCIAHDVNPAPEAKNKGRDKP